MTKDMQALDLELQDLKATLSKEERLRADLTAQGTELEQLKIAAAVSSCPSANLYHSSQLMDIHSANRASERQRDRKAGARPPNRRRELGSGAFED